MSRYLTIRFDVTGLTPRQVDALRGQIWPQGESNRKCAEDDEDVYPDVAVAEVCHFCGQVVESGECGGEGEGVCTELACVSGYDRRSQLGPEAYVQMYCRERQIDNAPVPYRDDGLTYYDQLAFLVREYHDLPQPKRKMSRRLP